MPRKVMCGVIGLGNFGHTYCKALKEIDKAELICVSDIREHIARKTGGVYGSDWYTSYCEMLKRKDLDAVFIATPTHFHAEQTIAALEAGKHVLCTKPMATTLKDADDMVRMARRTGLKLEIGYNRRYDKPIVKTKELIDSNRIGRIFYAKASLMEIRPSPGLTISGRPPAEEYWKWMGKKVAGGGCLMTQHSHELDYMRWFLGPVDWVMGRINTLFHPIEVEDVASAIIKFKNGTLLSFNSSTAALASMSPTFEIFGTKGVISARTRESSSAGTVYPDELLVCNRSRKWEVVVRRRTDWFKQQVMELNRFVDCILEDEEPFIPGEEGRKTLEMVIGIYRSSKKGRFVQLPLKE